MKRIELPHGIVVQIDGTGGGDITSPLHDFSAGADEQYNGAIDGLESLILAHACSGVNVESPEYIEGINTALDAIGNNY